MWALQLLLFVISARTITVPWHSSWAGQDPEGTRQLTGFLYKHKTNVNIFTVFVLQDFLEMENDTGMILGKSFYHKLPTGTVGLDHEIIDLWILFS